MLNRTADCTYIIGNRKADDAYDEREQEAELHQTATLDTKKIAAAQRPPTGLEGLASQSADEVGLELFAQREQKGSPKKES